MDPAQGESRTVGYRRLLNGHAIFQAPLWFGIPNLARPVETHAILVHQWILGTGQLTPA